MVCRYKTPSVEVWHYKTPGFEVGRYKTLGFKLLKCNGKRLCCLTTKPSTWGAQMQLKMRWYVATKHLALTCFAIKRPAFRFVATKHSTLSGLNVAWMAAVCSYKTIGLSSSNAAEKAVVCRYKTPGFELCCYKTPDFEVGHSKSPGFLVCCYKHSALRYIAIKHLVLSGTNLICQCVGPES